MTSEAAASKAIMAERAAWKQAEKAAEEAATLEESTMTSEYDEMENSFDPETRELKIGPRGLALIISYFIDVGLGREGGKVTSVEATPHGIIARFD